MLTPDFHYPHYLNIKLNLGRITQDVSQTRIQKRRGFNNYHYIEVKFTLNPRHLEIHAHPSLFLHKDDLTGGEYGMKNEREWTPQSSIGFQNLIIALNSVNQFEGFHPHTLK